MLFDQLRVIKPLQQDGVTTYLAVHTPSGRNYLLHWLPPETTAEGRRLLGMLDALPPDARKLIFEAGKRDGRAYLITENPTVFTGLEQWLSAVKEFLQGSPFDKAGKWKVPSGMVFDDQTGVLSAPPPVPAPPMPPPPRVVPGADEATKLFALPKPPVTPKAPEPTGPAPGEFTRMFQQIPKVAPPPVTPPAPSPPPPPAVKKDLGEFTRMFNPPQAPPPVPPAPPLGKEPGEFTRMFANPSANPSGPTPPPPSTPPKQEAGEFTSLFANQAPNPPSTPALPPRDLRPPHKDPGEFTRMFGIPSDGSQNAPAAPPKRDPDSFVSGGFTDLFKSPLANPTPLSPSDDPFRSGKSGGAPTKPEGDFTRMFGSGSGTPTPPVPPGPVNRDNATNIFAEPKRQPSAPPAGPTGPSEYTQMFSMPQPPAPAPAPPPPAKAAAAKPAVQSKSTFWLIALLSFLAVCVIILVVYAFVKMR